MKIPVREGGLTQQCRRHRPWSSCTTCTTAELRLVDARWVYAACAQLVGTSRGTQGMASGHRNGEWLGDDRLTQMPTADLRTVSVTMLTRAPCPVDRLHSLLPQNAMGRPRVSKCCQKHLVVLTWNGCRQNKSLELGALGDRAIRTASVAGVLRHFLLLDELTERGTVSERLSASRNLPENPSFRLPRYRDRARVC